MMDKKMEGLKKIVEKHLPQFETLETRKSDSLDFKEVAVWQIKDALIAAYELGLKRGGING